MQFFFLKTCFHIGFKHNCMKISFMTDLSYCILCKCFFLETILQEKKVRGGEEESSEIHEENVQESQYYYGISHCIFEG